ncbi:hypothetical protein QUB70_04395 [Microcoleus sp. A003_D6]
MFLTSCSFVTNRQDACEAKSEFSCGGLLTATPDRTIARIVQDVRYL